MLKLKTRPRAPATPLGGPLRGVVARGIQGRGRLHTLGLFHETKPTGRYVQPLESLEIASVPTYGTVNLRSNARDGLLIAPAHIGFFQKSAQNHATAQVRVLEPAETLEVTDCFCIQQCQGGLLASAQQRFLMLPHGLRSAALAKRNVEDYARLWGDIDTFTRRYGITKGGHFERFLRPFFSRLMPYRHCFEPVSSQVGAAWFVDGELVGVELCPNPAYFRELLPVLTIYGYGPEALLRDVQGTARPEQRRLDLDALQDVDDLAARLEADRAREETGRVAQLRDLAELPWQTSVERDRHGLRVVTLEHPGWSGQAVREGQKTVYATLFRAA